MRNENTKGYLVELKQGCNYCYLFVEASTKKAAIAEYENFTGESVKGNCSIVVRSNKIAFGSEMVKHYAINADGGNNK